MGEVILAAVLIAPVVIALVRWLASWRCRVCGKFFGSSLSFSTGELLGSMIAPRSRICARCATKHGQRENDVVV